jgi:cutinase
MKFATTLSVLAGFAAAAPTQVTQVIEVESRQLSTISNDLESGSSSNCPDAILIFARGSTELGNMVTNHSVLDFDFDLRVS